MSRRIGRPISNATWTLAIKEGRVAEAVDPAYGASAEDELAAYLSELLHVEAVGLGKGLRSAQSEAGPIPKGTMSSARLEAISRLAAEHAAGDEEVLRFRQRVLRRDGPMTAEEAEAYLDLPEARQSAVRLPDETMEVLRYHNGHITHDFHVWPDSPLDKLRKLAEKLAQSYPWQPAQAAAFVLEGLIPLATPFMLHLSQPEHAGRPRRAKLIMEVDLWMPASEVLRAYRQVQREVLPGHNRPISPDSIDLVNFVMRARASEKDRLRGTWTSLLERWNTEHPRHRYANYRSFRNAFERASRSLLHPTYRPYFGQRL
jgi:hypothetical protein